MELRGITTSYWQCGANDARAHKPMNVDLHLPAGRFSNYERREATRSYTNGFEFAMKQMFAEAAARVRGPSN